MLQLVTLDNSSYVRKKNILDKIFSDMTHMYLHMFRNCWENTENVGLIQSWYGVHSIIFQMAKVNTSRLISICAAWCPKILPRNVVQPNNKRLRSQCTLHLMHCWSEIANLLIFGTTKFMTCKLLLLSHPSRHNTIKWSIDSQVGIWNGNWKF